MVAPIVYRDDHMVEDTVYRDDHMVEDIVYRDDHMVEDIVICCDNIISSSFIIQEKQHRANMSGSKPAFTPIDHPSHEC